MCKSTQKFLNFSIKYFKVIDLNRNFGFEWKSLDGCTYEGDWSNMNHGSEAWSEAETRNVRDFILSRKGDWVVYDDVHAYSKLILLPWGYTDAAKPDNLDELTTIANAGARAIKERYGHNYIVR